MKLRCSLGLALASASLAIVRAMWANADTPAASSIYANLHGEVLLDNARVVVEKFVIAPGQSSGNYTPHGDRLLVFIQGGVLTSKRTGRAVLWRDGRVAWHGAGESPDAGFTNSGPMPIVLEWVTLKPVAAAAVPAPGSPPKYHYLNYPNIPGEDLLENDFVIVQRFTVEPGQWEGVHAHHPDMLYIHVKGGQWAARSKHEPAHLYPDRDPDGSVGWMEPIELAVGHESQNAGDTPIDLIWVTLKK
jgi:quercetin dioxygenase-like cupin family protein